MANQPILSIVITSYTTDMLKDIYELLDSIKAQTYKNIETVFVAERSQELFQKVKAYAEQKSIPNVKVVFNGGEPGLSIARNLGIKNSSGDIIGFTDDDAVLFPDWAEQIVKVSGDKEAIGVTGSAFPLWEDESLKWLPEEFYWLVSCIAWTGWKVPRPVRGAFGANMAFKREAFTDNCLFSPNAGFAHGHRDQPISEDIEFSLRLRKRTGKSILFDPSIRVWHRVVTRRLRFAFVVQRAHHIGSTRRITKRYYANEFGSFDQERHVLKGIFRLLLDTPRECISKPVQAYRKLTLSLIVLSAVAVGYLVPIPSYSPVKERIK